MSQTLRAEKISMSFDGLEVLKAIDLDIPMEQVSGLIGPNGAGKTTLVNVLTGFQKPTSGHVFLGNEEVTQMAPHTLRQRGVARTFQGGRLFKDLTVIDNLEVTGVGLGLSRGEAADKALNMLDWVGIPDLVDQIAGSLPYTDERRVGIARALMMEPSFLLLDEPAAGMSSHEADDLAELIGKIVSDIKCGVLLIEHNISLVLKISENIHVLDSGEMIDEGNSAHIQSSEKVLHAYMGTSHDVSDTHGAVL